MHEVIIQRTAERNSKESRKDANNEKKPADTFADGQLETAPPIVIRDYTWFGGFTGQNIIQQRGVHTDRVIDGLLIMYNRARNGGFHCKTWSSQAVILSIKPKPTNNM